MMSMKLNLLVLVAGLVGHAQSGEITSLVDSCEANANITKVTLDGCDQQQTDKFCQVVKGVPVNGVLEFEVTSRIEKLDCKLADSFGHGWLELPGSCEDGCDSLVEPSKCPLEEGDKAKLNFELEIDSKFPGDWVERVWLFKDEEAEQICFSIKVAAHEAEPGTSTPEGGKTTPEGGKTTPDCNKTTPESGKTTPEDGKTTPEDGKTTPDGGKTTPEGGKTTPDGGKTTPEGGKTTPGGGKTTPHGGKTTPQGGKTTPDDGKTTKEPGNAAAKPGLFVSGMVAAIVCLAVLTSSQL